jgi:hypothetical protein
VIFDFFLDFDYTSYRFGKLKKIEDLFTKYIFSYFQQFLALMAFSVLKMLRLHYVRSEIFFLKIGQHRYQKIRIFTLISANQTYLSEKMRLKKVICKKRFFRDCHFFRQRNLFFGNNFFGCILSLR